MEVSAGRLKAIFREMLSYSDSEMPEYIMLQEFKKIIEEYHIELIKGQELSDHDFHECCRQLFSQVCQKTETNTNFKGANLVYSSNLKTSNHSLTRTLDRPSNLNKRSQARSPAMQRKLWNKRGISSNKQGDSLGKTQQLQSLSQLRDHRKQSKLPSQMDSKGIEISQTETEDLVVEEDKLTFDIFKSNYKEFVTIRKLVKALDEKVERDLSSIPLKAKAKSKKRKDPKVVNINLVSSQE